MRAPASAPQPPDPLLVAAERLADVLDVVAAELRAVCRGEDERDHRLPHHAGRRHDGGVGALAQRLGRLAGGDVDRAQRLRQRRQRLHRRAHDERLSGRHAALETAGSVRLAVEAALTLVEDLVVRLRAGAARDVEAVAERDALARLDRAQRAGEAPVEALLPAHVRADAGHDAERDHLEHAADRLVRLAELVDVLDHRAARVAVQATDGVVVDALEVGRLQRAVGPRRVDGPDLHDVGAHLAADRAQERLAEPAARDTRGGLARARALEDVAHVGRAVLPRADEVGVAGARQVHLGYVGLDRPRVHPLLPVGEVAVLDLEGDRPAERTSVADPGGDLRAVALDLHAPAAAVAELAARHVAVDRLAIELEAGGQPLDDAGQAGAVRLAGGDELESGTHVERRSL